ncbi:MAG TPA: ABC transporter ATP-binding protein [Candidatus Limnocylindrales bacterium]|nr:ABC transporter ATP-binding protein [Candidatus Limnocylindrales bacterium]
MTIPHSDLGVPDTRSPGRYLLWLVRRQLRRVLWGATLGTTWMLALTLPPYLISRAIDDGLQHNDFPTLAGWVLAIAAAGMVNAVLGILRHRTMSFARDDAAFRSVEVLSRHVARLGASLSRRVSAGEVVNAGAADISQVAVVMTITGPGVGALIAYCVVAYLLWTVSPLLAGLILLGVPALTILVGPLLGRLQKAESSYRTHQGILTTRAGDIVAGLRILAGVGGRQIFAQRYQDRSRALLAEGYRVAAVTSWIQALAIGLPAVFLAGVVWLAARMAAAGDISIGEMVAVYGYVAMLVVPVSFFVEGAYDLTRGRVAAQRIINVLNLRPDHEDGCSCPPGPAALADLADPASGLLVPGGRLVGIATADLADALAITERLAGYEPSEARWGAMLVREICQRDLRERVLLSTNETYVFGGTMREILEAGRSRTETQLRQALHTAAADDVVASLGEREGERELDATVDPQGRNLSGGQRQRLRLARAVSVDPAVLILVEPTSAVDAHTEARIMMRLREMRSGRTTVIASSSPLVLHAVEAVAFVTAGKVAAVATHQELLAAQPEYRALVSRSLADEAEQVKG